MLGLSNKKIVFLSSATEANNLAIRGFLKGKKEKKGHLITTSIEHASILNVFKELEKQYRFYTVCYEAEENRLIINFRDLELKMVYD